eukprot:TRINITY_DN4877_c0_g1_i2.p1 TRINITY_DN4877_c0_g1~~TRINITY_DN4877_c0_g1_i2.p1  ORF type:complete len:489 (-),score=66.43 TRINITY_DN4877_c0_g1_i2:607-2073(-)
MLMKSSSTSLTRRKKSGSLSDEVYEYASASRTNNIISGELWAKKKYWFTLTTDHLFYFTDRDILKGFFVLKEIIDCFILDSEKFKFIVQGNDGREIVFKADSNSNMTKWVKNINEAVVESKNVNRFAAKEGRIEKDLYVKIWEAKNLKECVDSFCVIVINDTEMARTNYVWNDSSPNIYSEFNLRIKDTADHFLLRVYKTSKKNNMILLGQTSIHFNSSNDWYELELEDVPEINLHFNWRNDRNLSVHFIDMRNVSLKGAIVRVKYANKTLYSTQLSNNLVWDYEKFEINITDMEEVLEFKVYSLGKVLYGTAKIKLSNIPLRDDKIHSYPLHMNLGKIRVDSKLTISHILSDDEYDDLFALLLEDDMELIKMLSSVVEQPKLLASSLVNAFHRKLSSAHLIKELLKHEIETTESKDVLFRGNTVCTHSVDLFMRLIGKPYLSNTLKGTIDRLNLLVSLLIEYIRERNLVHVRLILSGCRRVKHKKKI